MIYVIVILIVSNYFRFKLISRISKKRDKCNLFTADGQAMIRYYNKQLDLLRFKLYRK